MSERATIPCQRCGAAMPAPAGPDAPAQCLRCLLGAGLGAPDGDGGESLPEHFVTNDGAPFEAPSPEDLAPFFPQLQIESVLGQGGMGVVYLARHRTLDRRVALKLISERVAGRPDFARRFEREARTLARLSHPNIVTVFDSGRAAGMCYLVMEYVDGVDLRRVLANEERLTPARALALVRQICDALEYAHAEGVVHRDIKPENILIDTAGRVKIADFGLAKLADEEAAGLTRSGPMGTLHYMAPEQVERPQDVDHRADIYSLGVVFYELLTGELPIGRFDPPSARARVDARLDDVVLKALAKEPDRRYQRASEIASEVEGLDGSARSQAAPAEPTEGRGFGWHRVRSRDGTDVITAGYAGGAGPMSVWVYGLGLALVTLAFHVDDFAGLTRVGLRPALLQNPLSLGGLTAGALLALAVQRGRAASAGARGARLLLGLSILAVPYVYGSGLLHELLEELVPVSLYLPGDPAQAPASTRGFGIALEVWSLVFLGSQFAYRKPRAGRSPSDRYFVGGLVFVGSVLLLFLITYGWIAGAGGVAVEVTPPTAPPDRTWAEVFEGWTRQLNPFSSDRWGPAQLGLLIAAVAIVGYRTDGKYGASGEFDPRAFLGLGGVYVAVFVAMVAYSDWRIHQLAMLIGLGGMLFHGGKKKRRRRHR